MSNFESEFRAVGEDLDDLAARVARLEAFHADVPIPPPPDEPWPTEDPRKPVSLPLVPSSAVVIYAADDAQAVVDRNPNGTVYLADAGEHSGWSVTPKDGDEFHLNGATLVGAGERFAFYGSATDVSLYGGTVTGYRPGAQLGAVNAQAGGSEPVSEHPEQASDNWAIVGLTADGNEGVGIALGPRSLASGCTTSNNAQLGITSHGGEDIRVIDHHSFGNNADGAYDALWEAGGSKFKYTTGLFVDRSWFHDEGGYGIWLDIDNVDALVTNCLVEDVTHSGFFQEIATGAAHFESCAALRCGSAGDSWLFQAGFITSTSSGHQQFTNCLAWECFNAFTVISQNRGRTSDGSLRRVGTVEFRDCESRASGLSGAVTDLANVDGFFDRVAFVGMTVADSEALSPFHTAANYERIHNVDDQTAANYLAADVARPFRKNGVRYGRDDWAALNGTVFV